MQMNYTLIRSKRKTLGLEIRGGKLIVRAPLICSAAEIDRFIMAHSRWIEKHLEKAETNNEKADDQGKLTRQEIAGLADKAMIVIPEKVRKYAPAIGVACSKITIRCQKTRWGSCSSKGNLSFNCLLMLAPDPVIESVVVHELCHLKHMDHSRKFYEEILRVFPEYYKWHGWLKENGPVIMKRAGF